jgi:hypothetical protein
MSSGDVARLLNAMGLTTMYSSPPLLVGIDISTPGHDGDH